MKMRFGTESPKVELEMLHDDSLTPPSHEFDLQVADPPNQKALSLLTCCSYMYETLVSPGPNA